MYLYIYLFKFLPNALLFDFSHVFLSQIIMTIVLARELRTTRNVSIQYLAQVTNYYLVTYINSN